MASFNKVFLMGNLTRDPSLKYLPNQSAVVELGIACNRRFRTQSGEDREEVTFVDLTAFGKTGEVINQYFTKGKPIFVEGRLKFDSWEDKQGGGKRSKLSVVIESFQFIGDRNGAGGEEGDDGGGPQQQQGGGRAGNGRSSPPTNRNLPPRPTGRRDVPSPFPEEQRFKEADIPF